MNWLRQMGAAWTRTKAAWEGLSAFNRLPRSPRRIVFYAETSADWAFLGPIRHSLERRGHSVVCVCSDRDDPALQCPNAFYVGFGSPRTILFRSIEAAAFVMTLSDLDTFHLKRSVNPTNYFYVFHSIASTHRVYRLHAFDAYDTILCVGPHHEREIRRMEAVYGLHAKRLLKHGYGRLDTLIRDIAKPEGNSALPRGAPIRVLLAPTWGESSLVHHGLESLVAILLKAQFHITLRLHPMTKRHYPRLAMSLVNRFASDGTLDIDPHINTTESLLNADLMISEWSGAPLEYAFARLRPVLFIDTPPKINNAEHARLDLPYLEDAIRSKIGRILPLNQLCHAAAVVRELIGDAPDWAEQIRTVRQETVYHLGDSGKVGAEAILDAAIQAP